MKLYSLICQFIFKALQVDPGGFDILVAKAFADHFGGKSGILSL